MSRYNPLLCRRPRAIWGYGIAILSVLVALWPGLHSHTASVSLFLCAVMVSAWLGGIGPGLLATMLSVLAFTPIREEISRLVVFVVSALFVGLLSATQRSATKSFRRARDDLAGSVQELQRTNEALHTESRERKLAEAALCQAQLDLERVSRVTTMGELTASLAHEINQPIAAAVTDAKTCLRWLTRHQPDLD